jgi:hypothetical protein
MTAGKIITAVIGALLALVALGLLIGGGTLLWAYQTQRTADGYFESPSYVIRSDGYAIVTSRLDMAPHPGDWWPHGLLGSVRLHVRATEGTAVFVGIAPRDQVDAYLGDVARDEVTGVEGHLHTLRLTSYQGAEPSTPPYEQGFWVAAIQGAGEQTLVWNLEQGEWTAVIMNADAASTVSVSVVAGVRLPILGPIGIGLVVGGFVLAALASVLLVAATRRGVGPSSSYVATDASGTYPARLEATLDEPISPVLWLVKWFLAIPHFIVLAFLWAAFALLCVIAWIAILFTGRYPKGIFDFNVGVLRWSWRVAYYSYAALGTDRYPPFTLADVDYPTHFSVVYPERLSRGLALVKWWLLALPHYLVVGVLTSGLFFWSSEAANPATHNPVFEVGGGLIAVLVFIAAVALLFTGRYPRGLFDLVLGLNRWVFRVVSYVTLLTDEYPPFRLDLGGGEPHAPDPSTSLEGMTRK